MKYLDSLTTLTPKIEYKILLFDLGVSFIAIDLEPEFKSTPSLLFCFMEAAIFVVIVY
jgi:hypothetical protein